MAPLSSQQLHIGVPLYYCCTVDACIFLHHKAAKARMEEHGCMHICLVQSAKHIYIIVLYSTVVSYHPSTSIPNYGSISSQSCIDRWSQHQDLPCHGCVPPQDSIKISRRLIPQKNIKIDNKKWIISSCDAYI